MTASKSLAGKALSVSHHFPNLCRATAIRISRVSAAWNFISGAALLQRCWMTVQGHQLLPELELPDLLGSLLPVTPTAMALLGVSPQELLAHSTHKGKSRNS